MTQALPSGTRHVTTLPVPLSQIRLEYPADMADSGIKGVVIVDCTVDRQGHVQNPVVKRTNNPGFDFQAIKAMNRWKFKPATRDGIPVEAAWEEHMIFSIAASHGGGENQFWVKGTANGVTPSVVLNARLPVYPYELRRDGVTGSAKAEVTVDARDRTTKIEIIESTRPEFAGALTAAIEAMAFSAAVKDGRLVSSIITVNQGFNNDKLKDREAMRLLRMEALHQRGIYDLKDLDGPPRLISRRAPLFPRALAGKIERGSATLEVLVDQTGQVRLPRVVAATDPAFGFAAAQAVASWVYEPPTVRGDEVIGRLRVPVDFSAPEAAATASTRPVTAPVVGQ